MKREIANLPPGTIVDIPADWAQMPEAELTPELSSCPRVQPD
jgi:hypothetical protein